MEWLDVLDRIGTGETERTEFKRGLGDLSAVGNAVCAFANTVGGTGQCSSPSGLCNHRIKGTA